MSRVKNGTFLVHYPIVSTDPWLDISIVSQVTVISFQVFPEWGGREGLRVASKVRSDQKN
jgi:hypothetical protein